MNADYDRAERVQQNLDNFRQQMLRRWRWHLKAKAYPCRNPQYFSIYKVRIENIRKRGQP
jgi:hypothetical protein